MTIGIFAIATPVLSQPAPVATGRVKVPPKRLTVVAAQVVLVPEPR